MSLTDRRRHYPLYRTDKSDKDWTSERNKRYDDKSRSICGSLKN